jgi:hypothetical protein
MKITPDVFEAYLKCPTKCWLRSTGEPSAGNTYSEWVKTQNDSYRVSETRRLLAGSPKDEVVFSPDMENVEGAKWRLASSFAVQARMDSCVLESELHAVERVPAEGRGKSPQFIPIRFLFTNKLSKDDKLLLVLDAFALCDFRFAKASRYARDRLLSDPGILRPWYSRSRCFKQAPSGAAFPRWRKSLLSNCCNP